MEDPQRRALTDDELRSIREVVEYNWATEQRDYEDQAEDDRPAHIFNSLVTLNMFLRDLVR